MKFLSLLLLTTPLLSAQFLTPQWRGEVDSEHAAWDEFTSAEEVNFPDVVSDAPTDDANLLCTTSTAFLTGSGNIYSYQSSISLIISDSANYDIHNVFLQIAASGSELDISSVQIAPPDATSAEDRIPAQRSWIIEQDDRGDGGENGQGGGLDTYYAFQWDFSEAPMSGTYTIFFKSLESSMSLSEVSLDTASSYQEVPEQAVTSVPSPEITIDGDIVTISWPEGGNYQLESCADFTAPDAWQEVTAEIVTTDGRDHVTLPREGSTTFFRLKQS